MVKPRRKRKFNNESIDNKRLKLCKGKTLDENLSTKKWQYLMKEYYELNYLPTDCVALRFKRLCSSARQEKEGDNYPMNKRKTDDGLADKSTKDTSEPNIKVPNDKDADKTLPVKRIHSEVPSKKAKIDAKNIRKKRTKAESRKEIPQENTVTNSDKKHQNKKGKEDITAERTGSLEQAAKETKEEAIDNKTRNQQTNQQKEKAVKSKQKEGQDSEKVQDFSGENEEQTPQGDATEIRIGKRHSGKGKMGKPRKSRERNNNAPENNTAGERENNRQNREGKVDIGAIQIFEVANKDTNEKTILSKTRSQQTNLNIEKTVKSKETEKQNSKKNGEFLQSNEGETPQDGITDTQIEKPNSAKDTMGKHSKVKERNNNASENDTAGERNKDWQNKEVKRTMQQQKKGTLEKLIKTNMKRQSTVKKRNQQTSLHKEKAVKNKQKEGQDSEKNKDLLENDDEETSQDDKTNIQLEKPHSGKETMGKSRKTSERNNNVTENCLAGAQDKNHQDKKGKTDICAIQEGNFEESNKETNEQTIQSKTRNQQKYRKIVKRKQKGGQDSKKDEDFSERNEEQTSRDCATEIQFEKHHSGKGTMEKLRKMKERSNTIAENNTAGDREKNRQNKEEKVDIGAIQEGNCEGANKETNEKTIHSKTRNNRTSLQKEKTIKKKDTKGQKSKENRDFSQSNEGETPQDDTINIHLEKHHSGVQNMGKPRKMKEANYNIAGNNTGGGQDKNRLNEEEKSDIVTIKEGEEPNKETNEKNIPSRTRNQQTNLQLEKKQKKGQDSEKHEDFSEKNKEKTSQDNSTNNQLEKHHSGNGTKEKPRNVRERNNNVPENNTAGKRDKDHQYKELKKDIAAIKEGDFQKANKDTNAIALHRKTEHHQSNLEIEKTFKSKEKEGQNTVENGGFSKTKEEERTEETSQINATNIHIEKDYTGKGNMKKLKKLREGNNDIAGNNTGRGRDKNRLNREVKAAILAITEGDLDEAVKETNEKATDNKTRNQQTNRPKGKTVKSKQKEGQDSKKDEDFSEKNEEEAPHDDATQFHFEKQHSGKGTIEKPSKMRGRNNTIAESSTAGDREKNRQNKKEKVDIAAIQEGNCEEANKETNGKTIHSKTRNQQNNLRIEKTVKNKDTEGQKSKENRELSQSNEGEIPQDDTINIHLEKHHSGIQNMGKPRKMKEANYNIAGNNTGGGQDKNRLNEEEKSDIVTIKEGEEPNKETNEKNIPSRTRNQQTNLQREKTLKKKQKEGQHSEKHGNFLDKDEEKTSQDDSTNNQLEKHHSGNGTMEKPRNVRERNSNAPENNTAGKRDKNHQHKEVKKDIAAMKEGDFEEAIKDTNEKTIHSKTRNQMANLQKEKTVKGKQKEGQYSENNEDPSENHDKETPEDDTIDIHLEKHHSGIENMGKPRKFREGKNNIAENNTGRGHDKSHLNKEGNEDIDAIQEGDFEEGVKETNEKNIHSKTRNQRNNLQIKKTVKCRETEGQDSKKNEDLLENDDEETSQDDITNIQLVKPHSGKETMGKSRKTSERNNNVTENCLAGVRDQNRQNKKGKVDICAIQEGNFEESNKETNEQTIQSKRRHQNINLETEKHGEAKETELQASEKDEDFMENNKEETSEDDIANVQLNKHHSGIENIGKPRKMAERNNKVPDNNTATATYKTFQNKEEHGKDDDTKSERQRGNNGRTLNNIKRKGKGPQKLNLQKGIYDNRPNVDADYSFKSTHESTKNLSAEEKYLNFDIAFEESDSEEDQDSSNEQHVLDEAIKRKNSGHERKDSVPQNKTFFSQCKNADQKSKFRKEDHLHKYNNDKGVAFSDEFSILGKSMFPERKSDNKSNQEFLRTDNINSYAEFTGKTLFYLFQCIANQNETCKLKSAMTSHRQENKIFEELNANDEENKDIDLLKTLGNINTLGNGEMIQYQNLKKEIKHPIPKSFYDLDVVESGTGRLSFGENFSNFFSDILMQYNRFCCFQFFHNYVKKDNSRKRKSPKFTVKAKCCMETCSVEATIQQNVDEKCTPEEVFTISFKNDIVHQVGELRARRIIDDKKAQLQEEFTRDSKTRPADIFRSRLRNMNSDSFSGGNRSSTGTSINTLRLISSKLKRKYNSAENTNQNILELQAKLIEKDKISNRSNNTVFGYVHFPSISEDGISISLFDEGLVRLYHFLADFDTFYFDATGSLITPLKWLKNKEGKPKRILLYALTAQHPSKKCPPIPLFEYITSEHDFMSIRESFLRFKQIEKKVFGKIKTPYRIVSDFSRAIIQAIVSEFNGESLSNYLRRMYNLLVNSRCSADNFDKESYNYTILHICSYHFLKLNKMNCKKLEGENVDSKLNFSQRVIGRLVCSKNLGKSVEIMQLFKNVCTNEFETERVTQSLSSLEEYINDTNNILKDSETGKEEVAIEADLENETNSFVTTGEGEWAAYWEEKLQQADLQKDVPESAISGESLRVNKYYMPNFFESFRKYLPFVAVWSNIIYEVVPQRQKKIPLTNSNAELFFNIKKSDPSKINIPLVDYIEKNNNLRLSLTRQYVSRFLEERYLAEGVSKKSLKNLKSFFEITKDPQHLEHTTEVDSASDTNIEEPQQEEGEEEQVVEEEEQEEGWRKKNAKKTEMKNETYLRPPKKPIHFNNSEKPKKKEVKKTSKEFIKEKPRRQLKFSKDQSQPNCDDNIKQANEKIKYEDKRSEKDKRTHTFLDKLDNEIEERAAFHAFRSQIVKSGSYTESDSVRKKWDTFSKEEKEACLNETPLRNPADIFCVCRKTFGTTTSGSPMVACDLCEQWYHNDCINVDIVFAEFVPYFICNICISKTFYQYLAFIRYRSFSCMVDSLDNPDINSLYLDFINLENNARDKILYHQFPYFSSDNAISKQIENISVLSNKGITNQHNNCYFNSVIQLLLGSTISSFLPTINDVCSDLNNLLHVVKSKLCNEYNIPISFEFKDRKYSNNNQTVMGQILQICMDKHYKEKEMVDAAEFLDHLLTTLYDENDIFENPFQSVVVDLEKCNNCGWIAGQTQRRNVIETYVYETFGKRIGLESLLWGSLCCDLDLSHGKICSKCNCKNNSFLNVKSFLKTPKVLIISTNRAQNLAVTKTSIEIPEILDLRDHICYNSNGISKVSTYLLSGIISFRGESALSGHYITTLFSYIDKSVVHFDDGNVFYDNMKDVNERSFLPLSTDTHLLCYVKMDAIQSKFKVLPSKIKLPIPNFRQMYEVEKVYFGLGISENSLISSFDLASIFSYGWLNDNIVNAFITKNLPFDVPFISSYFYDDFRNNRCSTELLALFTYPVIFVDFLVIPINKNKDHWLVIIVWIKTKTILIIDSLDQDNKNEALTVLRFLKCHYLFNERDFSENLWSCFQHDGLRKQLGSSDCGIYMLTNIYSVCNRIFPTESLSHLHVVKYFVASEAINSSNEKKHTSRNAISKSRQIKNILTEINTPESYFKDMVVDKTLIEKPLKAVIEHVEKITTHQKDFKKNDREDKSQESTDNESDSSSYVSCCSPGSSDSSVFSISEVDESFVQTCQEFIEEHYDSVRDFIEGFKSRPEEVNFRLMSIVGNVPTTDIQRIALYDHDLIEGILGKATYKVIMKWFENMECKKILNKRKTNPEKQYWTGRFAEVNFSNYFVRPTILWKAIEKKGITEENLAGDINSLYGKYHKQLVKNEAIVLKNYKFPISCGKGYIQVTKRPSLDNYQCIEFLIPKGKLPDNMVHHCNMDLRLKKKVKWSNGKPSEIRYLKDFIRQCFAEVPRGVKFIAMEVPNVKAKKVYAETVINEVHESIISEKSDVTFVRLYGENDQAVTCLISYLKKGAL